MTVAAGVTNRVRRVVLSGTEARRDSTIPRRPRFPCTHDGTEEIPIATVMPLAEELRVFLAHLDGGPPPVSDVNTALIIAERLDELQRVAMEAV